MGFSSRILALDFFPSWMKDQVPRYSEPLARLAGADSFLFNDGFRNLLNWSWVLQVGHWTYECKGERKYVQRSSRTEILKRKIEGAEDRAAAKVKKEDEG